MHLESRSAGRIDTPKEHACARSSRVSAPSRGLAHPDVPGLLVDPRGPIRRPRAYGEGPPRSSGRHANKHQNTQDMAARPCSTHDAPPFEDGDANMRPGLIIVGEAIFFREESVDLAGGSKRADLRPARHPCMRSKAWNDRAEYSARRDGSLHGERLRETADHHLEVARLDHPFLAFVEQGEILGAERERDGLLLARR